MSRELPGGIVDSFDSFRTQEFCATPFPRFPLTMVAQSSLQSLKVYVAGNPGSKPAGNEDALIKTVRQRMNAKFADFGNQGVAVSAFLFGVEPMIHCLVSCTGVNALQQLGRTAVALHIYEMYRIAVVRTRIPKRYASVTDSEDAWYSVEAGVRNVFNGH